MRWWIGLALTLGALAAFEPAPTYQTDSDTYQQVGREFIVPDCSSIHCGRVLVPWVIERVPGPSRIKWKIYAVVCALVAAAGVERLCRIASASPSAARVGSALAALGGGTQLTLFDPYTADAFIYALVPWTVVALWRERFGLAAVAASIGALAKEFAVAPLWIFTLFGVLARRFDVALRSSIGASLSTIVWLALQLWLILQFNYTFADNPSSQVFKGGYLARWLSELGMARAAASLVFRYAPLAVLVAAGWRRSPQRIRQLALASAPAAVGLAYVQQPDRALWNFAFILVPLTMPAFAGGWTPRAMWFVGGYAASHLHLPPSVTPWVAVPGWAVATSAAWLIVRRLHPAANERAAAALPPKRIDSTVRVLAIASAVAFAVVLICAADVAAHRKSESPTTVNMWGYRGPVLPRKHADETRIALLGGSVLTLPIFDSSFARSLDDYLNNPGFQRNARFQAGETLTIVDLATPCDGVAAFPQTIRDYAFVGIDAAILYVGHDDGCADSGGWRRTSAVFRATGYLPMLPGLGAARRDGVPPLDDAAYIAAVTAAVGEALQSGWKVLVATHPFLAAAEQRRQDFMREALHDRFGDSPGFVYVDLRRSVAALPEFVAADGVHATIDGARFTAERLSQAVFRLLR